MQLCVFVDINGSHFPKLVYIEAKTQNEYIEKIELYTEKLNAEYKNGDFMIEENYDTDLIVTI